MCQILYITINCLVLALKELAFSPVKEADKKLVRIQSDMVNIERILKVLWYPEEEMTVNLRLERGVGIGSVLSGRRAAQAEGPELVNTWR